MLWGTADVWPDEGHVISTINLQHCHPSRCFSLEHDSAAAPWIASQDLGYVNIFICLKGVIGGGRGVAGQLLYMVRSMGLVVGISGLCPGCLYVRGGEGVGGREIQGNQCTWMTSMGRVVGF